MTTDSAATEDVQSELDERRVARAVAIGLPLTTVVLAAGIGAVSGVAVGILVLAAGALLGVIALLWASLRILSGDVELPPEIAALDTGARGVDALSARKKMLLRALKDLDAERALGKLDDADFEQVSSVYRAELRDLLRTIDARLEPYRSKAEEAARAYLETAGVADESAREELPAEEKPKRAEAEPLRVPCSKCSASNEPDAKFCKECGAPVAAAEPVKETESHEG